MIIDAHTHVCGDWCEPDVRQASYRGNGVNALLGMIGTFHLCPSKGNPGFWREQNRRLAQIARQAKGQIIPFGTVHPLDGEQASQEVERAVREDGIRGIKLHPHQNNFTTCSEDMAALCKTMDRLGIPLYFHCCYQPLVTPAQIGLLARDFPNVQFILGHSGWANEWTVAIAVARKYENIFLCTSGMSVGAMQQLVKSCDHERIAFGSDYPCGGPGSQAYEIAKVKALELSPALEEKIFARNIARLLSLEGIAS